MNMFFGFAWLPLCRRRRVNIDHTRHPLIITDTMLIILDCAYTTLRYTVLYYVTNVKFSCSVHATLHHVLAAASRRRTRVNNNRNRPHPK